MLPATHRVPIHSLTIAGSSAASGGDSAEGNLASVRAEICPYPTMLAAPLRKTCFSTLNAAVRTAPRAPRVRAFQSSAVSAAVKTRYTTEHEWISYDDETNVGTIGITDHAQNSLGDVVYVELPDKGLEVATGGACTCTAMLTCRPAGRDRVCAWPAECTADRR